MIVCSQAAPFGLPSRMRGMKGGEKRWPGEGKEGKKKSLVLQIVVVVTGTTRQVFDLIDFVPDKDKLIENMTS